jgi:anti-anti-sigma factor
MKITISEHEPGVRRINLSGRIDTVASDSLGLQFTTAVAMEKALVIVDLSGVDFMASLGIGIIVRAHNSLKLRGGKMVLLNPQPVVALVLEKTAIHTVIPIVHTIDEALAILKG